MSNYFELVSNELLGKLSQVKLHIRNHNPTIGVLTEAILRDFLRNHLPKMVSVEQGFILDDDGELSKQIDVIIYDSQSYSPFYRINDIVIVPAESVIGVVEVKTTINRQIFHNVIDYFKSLSYLENAKTYLFIFNSSDITHIESYFNSYKHEGDYQLFDYDTFHFLPDEITGINESYHLKKDYVITDRDSIGYSSHAYKDIEGTEINALQHFYLSIYGMVEGYMKKNNMGLPEKSERSKYYKTKHVSFRAFDLFEM